MSPGLPEGAIISVVCVALFALTMFVRKKLADSKATKFQELRTEE